MYGSLPLISSPLVVSSSRPIALAMPKSTRRAIPRAPFKRPKCTVAMPPEAIGSKSKYRPIARTPARIAHRREPWRWREQGLLPPIDGRRAVAGSPHLELDRCALGERLGDDAV